MGDHITAAASNADGSWAFNYTFDNGSGTTCQHTIVVEAPSEGEPEWTASTAKEQSIVLARAQKEAWLAEIASHQITGNVVL